ncbi:hypothetical protein ABL78_5242 [Leptomonas seymouri]|uniref:Uncharacterized protein n=1 Tax=Leptomonas seymouri TaxID=5684 RepID=A0A0N1HVG9_LEPSE|nr:hypothetical protein ABL78_5242 [Leptomonas seymouri]|eukprot:KPI85710.1 hypothetical protein ABL78_5242 [Leptomonas seymouri]
MDDGSWAAEWAYATPSEMRSLSAPPQLVETTSEYYSADGTCSDPPASVIYGDSDISAPLSAFRHRVSPRADPYDEWEASLVIAARYWHDPSEGVTSPTLQGASASPPSLTHPIENTALSEDWDAALTSQTHTNSGRLAGAVRDASLSDMNTSSTILVIHGDFTLTVSAQRLLDRGSSLGLLPSAAQKTATDSGEMPTARGTLILKNNGAGYLLDWRPSTLENSQKGSDTTPRLEELVALSEGSSCTANGASSRQPLTGSQKAAALACMPLRRSPASRSVDNAEGGAGETVEAHAAFSGPPWSTTQTAPELDTPPIVPAGSRWSRDGLLGLSVPPISRTTAAVSAAQRKASSAPLLPIMPPRTPLLLPAHPAVLRTRISTTAILRGSCMGQSTLSMDSELDIELPPTVTLAQQRKTQQHESVPPNTATPLAEVVEAQHPSPDRLGSTIHVHAQLPASPPLMETTRLHSGGSDATASWPPLPPPSPPQPSPLLESVKSSYSPWVLLDSISEESSVALSGMVKSLARLVETAEGDAENTVITLRPVSSLMQLQSSMSNSLNVSKTPLHTPKRHGDAIEKDSSSVMSLAEIRDSLLYPQKGDEAQPKKSTRGRHDGSGVARAIPLAISAVASFYDYTNRNDERSVSRYLSGFADGCSPQVPGRAASLNSNGRPSSFFAEDAKGSTANIPGTPPTRTSARLPAGARVEILGEAHEAQQKESGAYDTTCLSETSSPRGETAPNNGEVELIYLEMQPLETINRKLSNEAANKVQTFNMRDEAMKAFPSIPVTEQSSPMGEGAAETADRDSKTKGSKVDALQTGLLRPQRPPQLRAEAPQAASPFRQTGSPSQRKRRVMRLVRGPPPSVKTDAPAPPEARGKPQLTRSLAALRRAGGSHGAARPDAEALFTVEPSEGWPTDMCRLPPSPPARHQEPALRDADTGGSTVLKANKFVGSPAGRTPRVTFSTWDYIVKNEEAGADVNLPTHQRSRLPADDAGAAHNSAVALSTAGTLTEDPTPGVPLGRGDDPSDSCHGRASDGWTLRRDAR